MIPARGVWSVVRRGGGTPPAGAVRGPTTGRGWPLPSSPPSEALLRPDARHQGDASQSLQSRSVTVRPSPRRWKPGAVEDGAPGPRRAREAHARLRARPVSDIL